MREGIPVAVLTCKAVAVIRVLAGKLSPAAKAVAEHANERRGMLAA